jgi:tetratricopeptide (TPR) repeat protein
MRRLWLANLCAAAAAAQTLLVLPFAPQGSRGLEWIGESIAETVGEALALEGWLSVAREDRAAAYARLGIRENMPLTRATVIKIAQTLDAEQVIYGEFAVKPAEPPAAARGSLRLTAHLLDLRRTRQSPEFSEVGAVEDLARLQNHLAWQTLVFLKAGAAPSEEDFLAARPAVRFESLEAYTRGLLAPEDAKAAYFIQAARLDPRFPQPNFELGRLHFRRRDFRAAAEALAKLPPGFTGYREGMFYLGLSRYELGDFAAAEKAFQTIAESVPLNEVWNNLAAAQSRRGSAAAIENFRRAVDGDPGDPDYQFNLGYALWKKNDFAGAAAAFRTACERSPGDQEARLLLERCEKRKGPRAVGRDEGRERLKTDYQERAFQALKSILTPAREPRRN